MSLTELVNGERVTMDPTRVAEVDSERSELRQARTTRRSEKQAALTALAVLPKDARAADIIPKVNALLAFARAELEGDE